MNKQHINSIALLFILLHCFSFAIAQQRYDQPIDDKKELQRLKMNVEKYPDSVKMHKAYIDAMGILNVDLVKQYQVWVKKFAKSSVVPFVIGDTLSAVEQPSAREFLKTSIERNPDFAPAYKRLAFDADRWGDAQGYSDNMAIASKLEPKNADYAYYYASSLYPLDMKRWKLAILDVAKRFKDHQKGRQAMFILADKIPDLYEKVYYLQRLHDEFDKTSSWYRVGMETYYDILLDIDAEKALALAREMVAIPQYTKVWTTYVKSAELVIQGKSQLRTAPAEALTSFDAIRGLRSDNQFINKLPVFKAQALDLMGETNKAYGQLISYFIKVPSVEILNSIKSYGMKLQKSDILIKQEVRDSLFKEADQATEFKLNQYMNKGQASLADFKGKAILLTYWFPGCGPCRAEFPHFENVLRNYNKGEVTYLGINIDKNQNDYVVPFMKKTGYSFIPLEEVEGRKKGNLDNGRSAPVNFIIDKTGKILFSKFRINANNQEQLRLMLDLALGG